MQATRRSTQVQVYQWKPLLFNVKPEPETEIVGMAKLQET